MRRKPFLPLRQQEAVGWGSCPPSRPRARRSHLVLAEAHAAALRPAPAFAWPRAVGLALAEAGRRTSMRGDAGIRHKIVCGQLAGGNIATLSTAREQCQRGFSGLLGGLFAMYQLSYFIGQHLLGLVDLAALQARPDDAPRPLAGRSAGRDTFPRPCRPRCASTGRNHKGEVLLGSSHSAPFSVLPILRPSWVNSSWKVQAKAFSLSLRRTRSAPPSMLLHWSLPPISKRQP